jgi:hypothetical protein
MDLGAHLIETDFQSHQTNRQAKARQPSRSDKEWQLSQSAFRVDASADVRDAAPLMARQNSVEQTEFAPRQARALWQAYQQTGMCRVLSGVDPQDLFSLMENQYSLVPRQAQKLAPHRVE